MKMNEKKEKLFLIITLVLCLVLFLKWLTGEIGHILLGMFLIILLVVHICKKFGKIKYMNQSVRLVDWGLMAALAVVFVTGMLLHPLHGMMVIKILHKLFSVLLAVGMIVHVVQHRDRKSYKNKSES